MVTPETLRLALAATDPQRRAVEFRAALDAVPVDARDAWLDDVLGVDPPLEDGPDLPSGCVPYFPCPVDVLLLMLEIARVGSHDVFVDVGSGIGRVTALTHFLTGAGAIGIEVQASLAGASRAMTRELGAERVATIAGDASELVAYVPIGTVFFLYCPFSGARLERVLDALRSIAVTRPIRICCVHVPRLTRPWLELVASPRLDLDIYRSTIVGSVDTADALGSEQDPIMDDSKACQIVDDATCSVDDDELESLLRRVYVGGGFTNADVAAAVFRPAAVRARGRLLCARAAGGALIGTIIVVPPDSAARRLAAESEVELHLLAVDARFRGWGVGRALVRAGIELAERAGYEGIVLWTQPTMHAAHHVYEQSGFSRSPSEDFEAGQRTFQVYRRSLQRRST